MLTRKQRQLLQYIHDTLLKTGVAPSFDEMKQSLGLKSKSGVHRLIIGLEERGFIRRLPHRARALEISRLSEDQVSKNPRDIQDLPSGVAQKLEQDQRQPQRGFVPHVIKGDFTPALPGSQVAASVQSVQLPLYGKIAAGTPIEALRDHSMTIDVPASFLSRGEHYALTVDGDSMIEAGIQDGDTVIIERSEDADTGAIVVALIDDNEVTLKRLRKKGASVALEPANPAHKIRIFGPDRVRVQGRLVGLIRRY